MISTVGFAGGLDYHYTPDTVLGFAFAGGGTNWSLSQGLGGGKSDAFQAGLDCACECYAVIRAETDKLMGSA